MPPKQRITREMILERSFAMFCKEGMESVNARSVAKALNCSTQPIFSYFFGMEDLKNALDQKARDTFEITMADAAKTKSLVDCCCAYIHFATEQPCVFSHLFMCVGDRNGMVRIGDAVRSEVIAAECEREGLDEAQVSDLYTKLWTYAHGLASMSAIHRVTLDEESVNQRMSQMHRAIVEQIKRG